MLDTLWIGCPWEFPFSPLFSSRCISFLFASKFIITLMRSLFFSFFDFWTWPNVCQCNNSKHISNASFTVYQSHTFGRQQNAMLSWEQSMANRVLFNELVGQIKVIKSGCFFFERRQFPIFNAIKIHWMHCISLNKLGSHTK